MNVICWQISSQNTTTSNDVVANCATFLSVLNICVCDSYLFIEEQKKESNEWETMTKTADRNIVLFPTSAQNTGVTKNNFLFCAIINQICFVLNLFCLILVCM